MLKRAWLSVAWVAAVVGALLGAFAAYVYIRGVQSRVLEIEPEHERVRHEIDRNQHCWLSRSGNFNVVSDFESILIELDEGELKHPGALAEHKGETLINAQDCLNRMRAQREKLASDLRSAWAGLVAALILWPGIVYGIYRWGLWLVGHKREPTTAPVSSDAS